MRDNHLRDLLQGMAAMGAWIAALFFLRFWRASRDRLFGFFAVAFGLLGLNWVLIVLLRVEDESRHLLYAVRLVAFLVILAAIWDKNRAARG